MQTNSGLGLIPHLRRWAILPAGGEITDGQLLEEFIARRDEAAFHALVKRHGPMVFGVCRRILRHWQDAEDAFQATFVVLARKAEAIEEREQVGNWLYGVAYRTALDARRLSSKYRAKEKQVESMPDPIVSPREVWQDLRPVLDEELSRLPDKYRLPVVLCDLEGRTRKEVARQLGVPDGTLSNRLATARRMLANRLSRRGLALSGGIVATILSESAAPACVPAALVVSTTKAAVSITVTGATATALSAKVAALTQGALKTMFITKLKTTMGALLVAGLLVSGLLVAGLGALSDSSLAQQPVAQSKDKPPDNKPVPALVALLADEVSVQTAQPVVVRTVPQDGATDVDPKATEIKVTFSKDMEDGSWSWSQLSEGSFPKIIGKPSYLKDKRTCVVKVKLEPGKTYAIWLNSEKFQNFKDADGRPAVPYLLVFQTGK